MAKKIKKIGVIGAGTMGTGIAAQAANAGIEVVLLDLTKERADDAIARMQKARPTDAFNAGFMDPKNAKNITTGSSVDDLALLSDCDWVCESILVPDNKIRQNLYKEIQKVAKKDCIFSSNTSMDQTEDMTEDQDEDFKKRFLNTHFFNPVRFMHLLEVIPSEYTEQEHIDAIAEFGDKVLGKKIVMCKDERGFIANRIGIYAIERAMSEVMKQGTKIEDVDALMGEAFGFPRLGLFKLCDEVGLDVVDHVRTDFSETLPEDDSFQQHFVGLDGIRNMLEDGYVGNRKTDSKGGFYRKKKDEDGNLVLDEKGKPVKEALDLATGEYRDFENSPFFKFERQIKKLGGFQKFLDSDHEGAQFVWPVMRDIMLYVLDHAEELGHDVQSIDDAMRAGYNWQNGPFQLLDKFGVEWFTKKIEAEGFDVPDLLAKAEGQPFYQEQDQQLRVRHFDGSFVDIKREEGVINLEDIKRKSKPLVTHNSASLWDIGDGVVCLEYHSQQNSIDPSILYVMNESIKLVSESDEYKAMVIYNDAPRFSVGANLKLAEIFMTVADNKYAKMLGIANIAEKGLKGLLHELIYQGQAVYTALHQAPFPVIGAPKGNPQNMAFGGGLESLLNCDAVQSGPEQVMGLPEAGVGILPAWTGSTRYLQRAFDKAGQPKGAMAAVINAGLSLANPMLSTATNAQDAKKKMWLRKSDGITMNPDRVLADAKQRALDMVPGYEPEPLPTFSLPGPSGKGAVRMSVDQMYLKADNPATGVNHVDVRVIDRLADVLTGGETMEPEDIDRHAVKHQDHLKKLAAEKPDGHLTMNPSIEINYNRMMQLERDNIISAFNDREHTWPRVKKMLNTNQPLREPRPDPAPTPKEIRDSMEFEPLPRRDIDGKPLSGRDAEALYKMARMTTEFYKQNAQKTATGAARQGIRTLAAIKRVFDMF